ncbi:hypothetical protein VN97_g5110 [Penicillium thymicola]|uniref:Uncharacterized protein n=1 Tax=Penicillium thymicola TaxID=293382 RepID=A0AAI9X8V3_PENTH|nr:hypothetical protein VN97_g5110 [Penicillium thymicola]
MKTKRAVIRLRGPRLELYIEKKSNGLLIFTVEDCDFHFSRDGIELEDAETFRQFRFSLPQIFADGKQVWKSSYLVKKTTNHDRFPPLERWLSCFRGLEKADPFGKHPANEEPRVHPRWLEDPKGIKPAVVWQPPGPYFLNDHERQKRVVEVSYIERAFIRGSVNKVFNLNTRHRAIVTTPWGNQMRNRIHVKSNCEGPAPTLTAMTSVNFFLLDETSAAEPVTEGDFKAKGCKGTVLDDETLRDFIIDHYGLLASREGIEHNILITTTPNTLPIDEQIKALTMACTKACVYDCV